VVLIPLAWVGTATLLSRGGTGQIWAQVNTQTLGTILSAIALIAFIFVSRKQLRQIQAQQLRAGHVELMTLALNNKSLAAVLPRAYAGISDERHRQYIFANLLVQHIRLAADTFPYSPADIDRALGHLFEGPLMRDFWRDTESARLSAVRAGSPEDEFNRRCDKIYTQYETVVHLAAVRRRRSPAPRTGSAS
jgi:hypothetical protein